jgi:hypothetical protein
MKKLFVSFAIVAAGLLVTAFTDDVNDCIGTAKYVNGLSQKAAVKVCAGVKDKKKVKDCVGREKYQQNMMDEEDLVTACSQSGVIRVID